MSSPATRITHSAGTAEPSIIKSRFEAVRQRSLDLVQPLSAEDACVQSMPDASPAKWHLAHVTWFFETFILEPQERGFKAFNPAYRELFNSYYNGVGKQFSRPDRGMITRPSLAQVIDYRHHVDAHMLALLDDPSAGTRELLELGLQHEQQHQELLLMDIKHLLSLNPLFPAYSDRPVPISDPLPERWLGNAGGLVEIGHHGDGFHFDNEQPRHRQWLEPFEIAASLVTNGQYLEFINDGGYRQPLLWLADGWAAVNTNGWAAPAYWHERDGEWYEFTLHGLVPLDPNAPLCHVSHFEADAYAQWRGARLPSEGEWEHAAAPGVAPATDPALHPRAVAGSTALSNASDAVWQWTRSAYLPYPGFSPAAGAVGEYNGKFMSGQMTLRGGACITQAHHARATYRNFFYAHQRWAFGGVRLARDVTSQT